jgi:hypothetical protein
MTFVSTPLVAEAAMTDPCSGLLSGVAPEDFSVEYTPYDDPDEKVVVKHMLLPLGLERDAVDLIQQEHGLDDEQFKLVRFFRKVEVTDDHGSVFGFDLQDPSNCALMFDGYKGKKKLLVYADLQYIYVLPGEDGRPCGGRAYVLHGLLRDEADLKELEEGRRYLKGLGVRLDKHELVDQAGFYIKRAEFVEGQFRLDAAPVGGAGPHNPDGVEHLFCTRAWGSSPSGQRALERKDLNKRIPWMLHAS